jgi:hypothetical protein
MARQTIDNKLVLAGGAFALGLAVGLVAKGAAKQMSGRARAWRWQRQSERTITHDNNLPDQLERRDPAPGETRYGGTGALGVPPVAAVAPPSGD